MNNISKKVLLINIILSQMLITGAGILLIFLVFKDLSFSGIFTFRLGIYPIFIMFFGSALLIILQLLFHKYLTHEKLFDEINVVLMDRFTLRELFIIFALGALAEEFLFRGIIQNELGIVIASLVFTITHIRYFNKYYIMAEVFLMGMILGGTYALTSLLWVPVVCHFTVNFVTAVLIKKGFIEIHSEK